MKSGCSGALKPGRLGLGCKVNKCSDAGTGDLGMLTTHETSPWLSLGDAASSQIKTERVVKTYSNPKILRYNLLPWWVNQTTYVKHGKIKAPS